MNRYILFLLAIVVVLSCNNIQDSPKRIGNHDSVKVVKEAPAKNDTINYIDTVIKIKHSNVAGKQLDSLTEEKAKTILHNYFIHKGICEEQNFEELPNASLSYDYDTIHFVYLNNDKFKDAIIRYWLAPIHGSSHCYQPLQGMIVSSAKGYYFTKQDFMGDFFEMDSITSSVQNGAIIYGGYFNCGDGDEKVRKWYKVHITTR